PPPTKIKRPSLKKRGALFYGRNFLKNILQLTGRSDRFSQSLTAAPPAETQGGKSQAAQAQK
ncbi:MAG: hypothetical protein J6S54_05210, partial [Lentisphaeria bacterium]|nr:hypothetical protein [Lentisphaeria bacterium]